MDGWYVDGWMICEWMDDNVNRWMVCGAVIRPADGSRGSSTCSRFPVRILELDLVLNLVPKIRPG